MYPCLHEGSKQALMSQLDDGTECTVNRTADNTKPNLSDPVRTPTLPALN